MRQSLFLLSLFECRFGAFALRFEIDSRDVSGRSKRRNNRFLGDLRQKRARFMRQSLFLLSLFECRFKAFALRFEI